MNLDKKTILKITGILSFCIILYCALQNMSAVKSGISTFMGYAMPFIIGGALAFMINVPMRFVERHLFAKSRKFDKLRRPCALVLTLLIIAAVIALVCIAVIPQIADTVRVLAASMPGYMDKANAFIQGLLNDYPQLKEAFSNIQQIDWNSIISTVTGWLSKGLGSTISSTISVAGSAINGVVSAAVGFVFAIYILLQKETLGRQVRMIVYSIFAEKAADKFFYITDMSAKTFSNFLSGQCLEACILGCLFAIAMLIFKMPYITLISVLIAFTALIPIVGAFIGCAVGAFLIFMQNPVQALWFIVMFLIIQQIEGNLIYPRVVGNSVGLPAIWVLSVITIGGKLMGVIGMLVMIPLSSVIYALIREFVYKKLHTKNTRIQKMFFSKVKPAAAENAPEPPAVSEPAPSPESQKAAPVRGKKNGGKK
ncbi:MAG: AI-2E family transporter [Oscillospiraceae bacterium]